MTLTSAEPGAAVVRGAVRRLDAAWVLLGWALTRAFLAILLRAPWERSALADIGAYFDWASDAWNRSILPGRDFAWEYPPGAAPLVLLPAVDDGPWGYLTVFASVMVVVDGLFFGFLVRTGGARSRGVLLWLVGPLLLGPLFLERFDLVAAALAAVGLAVLRPKPAVSGALLTCAAAIKLWPAALLGLVHSREAVRRAGTAAAAVGATVVALSAATGLLPAFWTAWEQQRDRGLQVEAVAATVFSGSSSHPAYRHGSWEVTAPGAGAAAVAVSLLGLALMLCLILRWQRLIARGTTVDPALAGTTLTAVLLVFDKALSPQYMVWLLACLAVAVTRPFVHAKPIMGMALAACALTHVVYPVQYTSLLDGAVLPTVLLAVRNLLLVAIAVLLLHATWFGTPTSTPPADRR